MLEILLESLGGVLNQILIAVAGAAVWELVRVFGPKSVYYKMTKVERRLRLRNNEYPIRVIKSYYLHNQGQEINYSSLINMLKTKLQDVFSDFNITFTEAQQDLTIIGSINRSNFNIRVELYVEVPSDYGDEEACRIIVKQTVSTKFGSLRRALETLFWNLADLYGTLTDLITPASDKVKIELEATNLKIFTELFEKFGTTFVGSRNVAVSKKDKHTILSIEGKMGPELAKRLQEIIVLGHL